MGAIFSRMFEPTLLKVIDVDYIPDYKLLCTFNDGVTKLVDIEPLFQYPAFAELRDKDKFIQFGLDFTILWANGADIAPEYLYEHGQTVEKS